MLELHVVVQAEVSVLEQLHPAPHPRDLVANLQVPEQMESHRPASTHHLTAPDRLCSLLTAARAGTANASPLRT
jgi:hypothetical protein